MPAAGAIPAGVPPGAFARAGFPDPRGTPDGRRAEARGLDCIRIAMVIALVAALVGVVEEVGSRVLPFLTVTEVNHGIGFSFSNVGFFVSIIVLAAALAIAELVVLRIGLASLARVFPNEGGPAALAIVAIIGFVLLFLGVGLFFYWVQLAIDCAAGAVPFPDSCITTTLFYQSVALLGIGAVIALVGYIGVLIGLWRVGSAYADSAIKVGTVLLIFPFLNVIGAILILVRVSEHRSTRFGATPPGLVP